MGFLPDVRVEVAWDSGVRTPAVDRTWTDVSDYVELRELISISRGRADELSTTGPSTLDLTLDNSDGRFTVGNASSPYYPNVKLGRPIRVLANVMTDGDRGTFDANITGMAAGNGTLAQVGTPVVSGNALRLTATAAADASVTAGATTADGYKVSPGAAYQFSLSARRDSGTARTVRMQAIWYTAANAVISTDLLQSVTPTATAFSELNALATAPATADHVRLQALVVASAAGQIHYFDDFRVESIRFTGYVDEWPVEWDGTSAYASSQVRATSRLARLGEGAELRSVIETEILADDPVAYYPLGEPEGSLFAQEFTGSDTVGMYSYFGGSDIEFGTGLGPGTDGLPAVRVDVSQSVGSVDTLLAAYFGETMTECTVEVFAALPSGNDYSTVQLITLRDDWFAARDAKYLQVQLSTIPSLDVVGGVYTEASASGGMFAADEGDWNDGRIHHFAVSFVPGTPPVLKVYFDGVLLYTATTVDPGVDATTMPNFKLLYLGPIRVNSGSRPVTFAHAVVYDSALADDRIAAHAQAGLTGFIHETAGDRLERYAGYAGVDPSEVDADAGTIPLAHIDTTDTDAVSLMRIIESTEGGVLYDARDGSLRFRDRDHRYNTAASFTLDAALQQVGSDIRPVYDRSSLINSVTASSVGGGLHQRYEDTTAADDYGMARTDIEVASTDVDQLYQAAAWRVNRYKEPRPRIPALSPVDVLVLDAATRAAVVAADISTRFAVANLPNQAPNTNPEFFVEGITETIGPESWQFQFNASPSEVFDNLFILGTSQLDGTDVLAY